MTVPKASETSALADPPEVPSLRVSLSEIIRNASAIERRAGESGCWPYEPEELITKLVNGEMSISDLHLQAILLDWIESADYNKFLNIESGDVVYAQVAKRGKYLEARRIRLGRAGKSEDALFPPIKHNGGYISYGRIRTLKSMVEDDLEMKFDYRKCRRTFGQRAIDEGQSMHDVSLVMGHATTATTQKDYCDKDEHNAARDMQRFWSGKGAIEEQ